MSKSVSPRISPRDEGLPESAIRKRRQSRRVARIMLIVAGVTAIAGWGLFSNSIFYAIKIRSQSPSLVVIAWALLVVSSVTLVLGLWYLLLAQVERIARMVESTNEEEGREHRCGNCGWHCDGPDRFCRHCGKPLGASVSATLAGSGVQGPGSRI